MLKICQLSVICVCSIYTQKLGYHILLVVCTGQFNIRNMVRTTFLLCCFQHFDWTVQAIFDSDLETTFYWLYLLTQFFSVPSRHPFTSRVTMKRLGSILWASIGLKYNYKGRCSAQIKQTYHAVEKRMKREAPQTYS